MRRRRLARSSDEPDGHAELRAHEWEQAQRNDLIVA
jgi:hypothetical protein